MTNKLTVLDKKKVPYFSPATIEVAKDNLKKYMIESDESFLIRAEIERKLSFM